jgi:C-terminal processing protease CtpA/Prc
VQRLYVPAIANGLRLNDLCRMLGLFARRSVALVAPLLLAGCALGWPFWSRAAPKPIAPPPVDTVSAPREPDLTLPAESRFPSDSVGLFWALRLARAFDAARTFGAGGSTSERSLLADLARRAAAVGRADSDTARLSAFGTTPWRPLALRTPAADFTPPVDTVMPAAWSRTLFPSPAVRLASVIAIWSTLRHEYAHRALADDDWDVTLARVIPAALGAVDSLQYVAAIRDLLAATNDSRVTLDDPTFDARVGTAVLPIDVRSVEGQMTIARVDSTEAASGVRVGDIIERIDNDPVDRKLDASERLIGAANSWTRRRDAFQLFTRGPRETIAALSIRRLGQRGRTEQLQLSLRRVPRETRPVAVTRATSTDATGILTIDLSQLTDARLDSLRGLDLSRRPRALVLDLRHGVHVSAARRLARWLLDVPTAAAWLSRRTVEQCISCGLRLTMEQEHLLVADSLPRFAAPVALLIDERTAADAEEAALALLRAPNVTAIGSSSAGTVGPLAAFALPGGYVVRYPWAEVRWPDGRVVQRVGITPLLDVRATVIGVRDGRDEVHDAALTWLRSLLDPPGRRR